VPARDRGVGYAEEVERHRPNPVGNVGNRGNGRGMGLGATVLVGTPDPSGRERAGRIEAWRASITG
jgi:hypothetical protein